MPSSQCGMLARPVVLVASSTGVMLKLICFKRVNKVGRIGCKNGSCTNLSVGLEHVASKRTAKCRCQEIQYMVIQKELFSSFKQVGTSQCFSHMPLMGCAWKMVSCGLPMPSTLFHCLHQPGPSE